MQILYGGVEEDSLRLAELSKITGEEENASIMATTVLVLSHRASLYFRRVSTEQQCVYMCVSVCVLQPDPLFVLCTCQQF